MIVVTKILFVIVAINGYNIIHWNDTEVNDVEIFESKRITEY